MKSSTGTSSISLIYDDPLLAGPESEVILPVQVTSDMLVGAIAMIIDFPSELVSVEDVLLGDGEASSWTPLQFSVNGSELRIGWYDLIPLNLVTGDRLVTLKLRTTANFTKGHSIFITMQENPLNELGDSDYNPFDNVVLLTRGIEASTNGIDPQDPQLTIKLQSRPNPFYDAALISYTLPVDDEVSIEITNMYGEQIALLVDAFQEHGDHAVKLDGINMNPGVYSVTLRTKSGFIKPVTIKIVRGW